MTVAKTRWRDRRVAAHPSSGEPQMLTAAEAAARLGIKLGTLYAYVSRGWLKSYKRKVGRETLYRRADIDAMRGVTTPERGRRARSLPDASSWVTIAQPGGDDESSGVIVAESAISSIIDGQLAYRGYPIEELVEAATFEEVALLLWHGERPAATAIAALRAEVSRSTLPPAVNSALVAVGSDAAPLLRLQIMMPALSVSQAHNPAPTTLEQAAAILSAMPLAMVNLAGRSARNASGGLATVAGRLLYRALGEAAEWAHAATDRILIACAEHELNASTFAARVVASTGADLHASVLAALCSLSGPIHGGACDRIEQMLAELEGGVRLDALLAGLSSRHLLPPGFGHAIYPKGDPRAALLKAVAAELARHKGRRLLELAHKIEEAVWKRERLRPNLDFYLTVCVRMMGFPASLPAGVFALGRAAGWIAHSLEQYADNRLIRPRMRYHGSHLRHWAATK
ncbi:MAG TPA: citrate/2-methylcitrate synthase [Candidatus Binataceae bacterium]|nr:citrate/2-methylcitrate synthase [Candidatus Binataceae bacterium]